MYAGSFLLMSASFIATNVWSATGGLLGEWMTPEQARRQLGRASFGLFVYGAAVGLAFVDAIASLALCALVAVYYAFPSRV